MIKVGEGMVTKPLIWFLTEVLLDIVLPNEAILWIVQRVELVPKQTLAAIRSLNEVNQDFELGHY